MRGDLPFLDRESARGRIGGPSQAAPPDYGRLAARLQWFYGGHPYDWFTIPFWTLNTYAEMLPELQAEQQLYAIEAASVPHMTPQSKSGVFERLMRRVRRPATGRTKEEMYAALAASGVPIVHTKKKRRKEARPT